MTIKEYFGDWCSVIDLNLLTSVIDKIQNIKPLCPNHKNVFRAFELCSLRNLRVVLVGQDPYNNMINGVPVATGIAFANSKDTPEGSYSPSLEILRESVIDFTTPHSGVIFDQSLEKWEEQGVLCLNAALTCLPGKPESHTLLWRPFIKSFLQNLSAQVTGIVYVLMGGVAQTLEPFISKESNYIIRTKHPAYYARNQTRMPSDVWREINDILIGQNGYGIEWYKEL